MKYRIVVLLLNLVLMLLSNSVIAQLPKKAQFKHPFKIESIYTPATNITVVKFQFRLEPINERDYRDVYLIAGFYFTGKTISDKPPIFQFNVQSTSVTGWKFDKKRALAILVEKEKSALMLGETKRIKSGQFNPGLSSTGSAPELWYSEMLTIDLEKEKFSKIIEPRNVMILFGEEKFRLSKDNLEALRDLASRATP